MYWPIAEHGFTVDQEGNIWIGGSYTGEFAANLGGTGSSSSDVWDRQVLKFSPDGKLLLEIGHPTKAPVNNQDTSILGGASGIIVDDNAREVYIADGAINKRVVVYDLRIRVRSAGWVPMAFR